MSSSSSSVLARPSPPGSGRPRVLVHPGAGLVDRCGDVLLVVPVLRPAQHDGVRALVELCHRAQPPGSARLDALRAVLDAPSAAGLPGLAVLVQDGPALHALVLGPVQLLVDGRAPGPPAQEAGGRVAGHLLADGAWHRLTITAQGVEVPPDVPDDLPLDLGSGVVPGDGVTLVPAVAPQGPASDAGTAAPAAGGLATSMTALRPAVQFRSVLLGECAVHAPGGSPARVVPRAPLPVAGEEDTGDGAATPQVLVEGVLCPAGHFFDPDLAACPACGVPPAADSPRVTRPRPPCGILVTDGGTICPVTGDVVIGREATGAPDVVAGRARPLPLSDAARSTSRIHARVTVRGWKVLLSDNGSANGTFLSRDGAAGPWLRVPPEAPVPLAHGNRIRLGRRQLLFDAWRETVVPRGFR
jgi:FHA domain